MHAFYAYLSLFTLTHLFYRFKPGALVQSSWGIGRRGREPCEAAQRRATSQRAAGGLVLSVEIYGYHSQNSMVPWLTSCRRLTHERTAPHLPAANNDGY